jgi:ADP-ribosyltransferase exoenzyme
VAAQPSPIPFQPYRKVQVGAERDMRAILESTAKAIATRISRLPLGIGGDVRKAQLVVTLAAIKRMQQSMWTGPVRDTVVTGVDDAQKAAESAIETMTRVAYAALPDGAAEALTRGLRLAAEAGIKAESARKIRELSSRVYHQAALHEGKVEQLIREGLIAGLSAKELAKTVHDYVSPTTPGGASYAAMRLARTEINNAFHEQQLEGAKRPGVTAVKWNLSGSHRVPDLCNVYAMHGKGSGQWAVGEVPDKPHPQCFCYLTYITSSPKEFQQRLAAGSFDDEIDKRTRANLALLGQPVGSSKTPAKVAAKKVQDRKIPAVGSTARMTNDQATALSSDNATIRQVASNNIYDEFSYGSQWFDKEERGIDRKAGVREYFGNSTRINSALRNGEITPEIQNVIDEVDAAIKLTKTKTDLVVFRGVNKAVIGDAKAGDIVTDPIYWSTAVDPQQAKKFARSDDSVLLHIEVPKGTNVIAENQTETEVLLGRGTALQVVRRDGDDVYAVLVPTDGGVVSKKASSKGETSNVVPIKKPVKPKDRKLNVLKRFDAVFAQAWQKVEAPDKRVGGLWAESFFGMQAVRRGMRNLREGKPVLQGTNLDQGRYDVFRDHVNQDDEDSPQLYSGKDFEQDVLNAAELWEYKLSTARSTTKRLYRGIRIPRDKLFKEGEQFQSDIASWTESKSWASVYAATEDSSTGHIGNIEVIMSLVGTKHSVNIDPLLGADMRGSKEHLARGAYRIVKVIGKGNRFTVEVEEIGRNQPPS